VPEAHDRAEGLAGAIYGTVLVAGVLATTSPDSDPHAGETAFYVIATVLVFWLAHAWALTLGHRAAGSSHGRRRVRHGLAREWPLVQSAVLPLAALGLASLLGASDESAIDIALWTCIAVLAGWGIAIGRREEASRWRTARIAAGCAALGMVMVALKTIAH